MPEITPLLTVTVAFLAAGAVSSTRISALKQDGPIAFVHRFGEIMSGLGCKLARL